MFSITMKFPPSFYIIRTIPFLKYFFSLKKTSLGSLFFPTRSVSNGHVHDFSLQWLFQPRFIDWVMDFYFSCTWRFSDSRFSKLLRIISLKHRVAKKRVIFITPNMMIFFLLNALLKLSLPKMLAMKLDL